MHAVSLDRTSKTPPSPIATQESASVEQLGEAIADLAARIHAATYELLVMIRQFDERAGWNNGFLSCAHWLSWRTGIDLGACREKVRVSRALAMLPMISAALQRGALSYAKVRAVTRVATPSNEPQLVDAALATTAAQVERLVRAWRRVDRLAAADDAARQHLHRELHTWVDDDGMVVIRGRLSPEVGAVVQRALDAAADRLYREARDASVPAEPPLIEEMTPEQRRADALGLLAESALAANLDRGTTGDRYQVVVHVDLDAVQDGETGQAALDDPRGQHVSAETSRRLACDAGLVLMRHAADGSVLDVGRRTRTIPPAIRRALTTRDRSCRFPGCTARHCDAHHIVHWANGGATRLENLVLLCRRHHRLVHEGEWTIDRGAGSEMTFIGPRGSRVPDVPLPTELESHVLPLEPTMNRLASLGIAIDADLAMPDSVTTSIDLDWALDVLLRPAAGT